MEGRLKINIDISDLKRLLQKLNAAPNILEDARRRAMEEAAPKLKREVDTAIGGRGKVRSWQEQRVGSEGGYAAVSPKSKTWTEVNGQGKKYAVGHVTNAIEHGHRFPSPTGKNQRYQTRIESGRMRVPGQYFYKKANRNTMEIAREAAAQAAAELIAHLED